MVTQEFELFWLEGYCPVQAEGRFGSNSFYFRSRGNRWSLEINGWRYEEPYGVWPEAGWISLELALVFLDYGLQQYLDQL